MKHVLLGTSLALLAVQAPAAPPASSGEIRYTVKRGDTLIGLAARGFKREGDYRVAQQRNRIANPRRLRPGSILHIPIGILRVQPIDAKVIAFRGGATVAGTAARVGMPVRQGNLLATGADAFLTIELADGSLLTLPSRSTVKVAELHRILLTSTIIKRFDLVTGRTETEVPKAVQPSDRFEVRTPVSVAAVRGTRFRVTFGDNASGTGVLEGNVHVDAGERSVDVPVGTGVVATVAGPGAVVPLLPKPALTDPDKVQDDELVSFRLNEVAGAASYRVQLAKDAGFIEAFAEAETNAPAVSFAGVPNGSFFARATAISPAGLEGLPSVYSFERQLNSIQASVDEPDQCPGRRCLRFRWRVAGEGIHRYRFQLAHAPAGTPIIDEPEMTGNEIVLTDLPGGTYFWRVESVLIRDGRRQSKWMESQELRVASAARQ